MIKAAIVGATGYAGIELVRLLSLHPEVDLKHLISHSWAGKRLAEVYPQFNEDRQLKEYDPGLLASCDVVFTALPHGVSQKKAGELYERGVKIVDLSGDFRYRDCEIYEEWYQCKHEYPQLMKKSVYGLVEINREKIKKAQLVANPGCYPTASILAALPLLKAGILTTDVLTVDAKSGVSGAGRKASRITHYCEVGENVKAYGIGTHRHTSEIETHLRYFGDSKELQVSFTPHLMPMKRGILATVYAEMVEFSQEELVDIYYQYYEDSFFVRVMGEGSPETKHVRNSNFCQLGVNYDARLSRAIIVSAIDNLGKGAASQAVQNMNLMFSLPEETGLEQIGVFP